MLRFFLILAITLGWTGILSAQQLPYFTQFRQHQPMLNPASVSGRNSVLCP